MVENTGEINITEFKLIYQVTPTGHSTQDTAAWTVKDGWLVQKQRPYDSSHESVPMTINLYPHDLGWVAENEIMLMDNETLAGMSFRMRWKLHLRDTLPIEGEINLAQAYHQSAQQESVQQS